MTKILATFLLLCTLLIQHAQAEDASHTPSSSCTKVASWGEFVTAIESPNAYNTILLCPFSITHEKSQDDAESSAAARIVNPDTRIICVKRREEDRCTIVGSARHVHILTGAHNSLFMGIDFFESKHGAVFIDVGVVGSTLIDCGFFDNDRTSGDHGNGGAIEAAIGVSVYNDEDAVSIDSVEDFDDDNISNLNNIEADDLTRSKLFIMDSHFERNRATSGGSIYATIGTVTILSSDFEGNAADGDKSDMNGTGGAALLYSGMIGKSNFHYNAAIGGGPTIAISSNVASTCESIGFNYACSDEHYHDNVCDGVFNSNGSCVQFLRTCEYPSASPSSEPTMKPSSIPTISRNPSGGPSATPTHYPTGRPSSTPTLSPSKAPTTGPSSMPSKKPSSAPTLTPSSLPSSRPSSMPFFSPSSSPTSKPTSQPTKVSSIHPTAIPSSAPTSAPSSVPTEYPSGVPTSSPTSSPSKLPTLIPTNAPFASPSTSPTESTEPTTRPTVIPSSGPTLSMQPSMRCNISPEERARGIQNIILQADYDDKNILNIDIASNRTMTDEAAKWIVDLDELYLCPQADNILQRYYAYKVYTKLFDTAPPYTHECSWLGFSCNEQMIVDNYKFDGLSSKVPREFASLTGIESIVIQQGSMTGSIPTAILEIPGIKQIDFDMNEMSGTIPVVNNTSLERLDINFNNLTGGVDFLQSFPNLVYAQLDNNEFTGTIPESLGTLTNLKALTLHGNSLTGSMPESICKLYDHNLIYLMADCDGDKPKVSCPCCSHCNPYR